MPPVAAIINAPVMPAPPPPLTSIPASSPTLSDDSTPATINGKRMSNQLTICTGLSMSETCEKVVMYPRHTLIKTRMIAPAIAP